MLWEAGRPIMLDLFCGGGGCSYGYWLAGWNVVGVDMHPQPGYPFMFHKANALEYNLNGVDAIHASPPCQGYSLATRFNKGKQSTHPKLIKPIRERLRNSGRPWVIENVIGSEVGKDLVLCGTMFDLMVYRHRIFELSHYIPQPFHPKHIVKCNDMGYQCTNPEQFMTVCGASGQSGYVRAKFSMGWYEDCFLNKKQLVQSIPPSYTKYIGERLIKYL